MAQVTISDVAQEAGLSSSSVSRILRGGKGHVYSAATVERVHEIARRLGYRANAAARILSGGARTMIGMSVHFTEHPYLNRFLAAVHQELLAQEYDPVFLDSQHLSSEDSRQPFPPPHMLAGLISMGIDLQEGWPHHYAALREDIPIGAIQPISMEAAAHVDVVHVDCNSAYLQAFEHLIQLGHKHIAYVGVVENPYPIDISKWQGWTWAARQCGCSPERIIPWKIKKQDPVDPLGQHSDFIYQQESREGMMEVVARLKAFPERVTALMCGSDEVAIALQSHLQAQGWRLPRDLSVVGYDGISLGEFVLPALTTIAPDYDRMAQAAVRQLLKRINGEASECLASSRQISIEPNLIVRASTAPPDNSPF